ncbi:hypothetical protein [Albidovulum sp.]
MSDTDTRFNEALEEAKWRYSTHGLSASSRAYDYGILVVKNAFLVSGGGLFFIPAMVGLSADVDLSRALFAGVFFGLGVLLALLGNYAIHINWTLHDAAWDRIHEIERIQIRQAYKRAFPTDDADLAAAKASHAKVSWWITFTFWIPHVLAIAFVISLIAAAYFLYLSFGVLQSGGVP